MKNLKHRDQEKELLLKKLTSFLQANEKTLFENFIELEKQYLKNDAMVSLNEFVEKLETYPQDLLKQIVDLLCILKFDHDPVFPIRHPLFKNIILPVLLSNYNRNEKDSAKRLLLFSNYIHGGSLCDELIKEYDLSPFTLIHKAVQQNPDDKELKLKRIDMYADYFDYALHEVPAGVLYDTNGATAEQCGEMINDLSLFIEWTGVENLTDQYKDLIEKCKFHFHHYKKYLEENNPDSLYKTYIAEKDSPYK